MQPSTSYRLPSHKYPCLSSFWHAGEGSVQRLILLCRAFSVEQAMGHIPQVLLSYQGLQKLGHPRQREREPMHSASATWPGEKEASPVPFPSMHIKNTQTHQGSNEGEAASSPASLLMHRSE